MRHGLRFLFASCVVLVWGAATNAAMAGTYRLPEAGSPALVADAPPGWTGKYDAPGRLTISSADDEAILELEMISDSAMAAKPLPDVAREVLRSADLSPRWTGTEPQSIGGLEGQAFLVPIARDGVPVGLARVSLAKIDGGHIARLTEITLPKETPADELAALKAMVAHLNISGH